jgi:hypothetical protein
MPDPSSAARPSDDVSRRGSGSPQGNGAVSHAAAGATPRSGPAGDISAAPPTGARFAAFAAIVIAGVCGGLIGYAVTDTACGGDCRVAAGGIGLGSAVLAAVGVAIVAVLVLRAMGEWVRVDRPRGLPAPGAASGQRPRSRPSGQITRRPRRP